MFEHKTFEAILGEMLSYVSDRNPNLDTRDGSIIYTALAPIALELETAYHEMDMILEETFLETASKEFLVKHGNQIGIALNEATYGHFKGEFDVDVEVGSRFNLDKFNYNVIAKLASPTTDNPYYICELVCETAGAEPNDYFGDLTPITFIANISHAKLISNIIYGEDEEETEAYRYRIQTKIRNPAIDGNVAQYEAWLDEYDGIGRHRTIPCWNGVNTVKLLILDAEQNRASDELINKAQEYFDPATEDVDDHTNFVNYPQGRGMGNGKAPIGAIVTVARPKEVSVIVKTNIVLKDGYSSPVGVMDAINNYVKSLALTKPSLSYFDLASNILKVDCVSNINHLEVFSKNCLIDPSTGVFQTSIPFEQDEVPVFKSDVSEVNVVDGV